MLPHFFLNLGNAVNSPSGIPCLSSPLTASSISGYATAQLSGYVTSMVYICKLMSWQKRGHLLGNAPPLASAAAPFGEEWGLLRRGRGGGFKAILLCHGWLRKFVVVLRGSSSGFRPRSNYRFVMCFEFWFSAELEFSWL